MGPLLQVFNFLAEFMCTVALVFGAMMLGIRGRMVYEPARGLFGATGAAANLPRTQACVVCLMRGKALGISSEASPEGSEAWPPGLT